jgi:hypothetical protein
MARTPVLPEAIFLGALTAQMRRPPSRSAMSGSRRLRSYRTEGFLDLSDAADLPGGSPPRQWMDPSVSFWSAFDAVAGSATSGLTRKRRGVRPGLPDNWIVYRRKRITIEMKSRTGRCSAAQRAVRAALIRAGSVWWQCITALSAMWALTRSGVRVPRGSRRRRQDGAWRQPRLAPWEVPRCDPAERRPSAPGVVAERREVARRWRERKRSRCP